MVRGDADAVGADFGERLRPQVPETARPLPQPGTGADVLSVDLGNTQSVAMIRHSGRWQDEGGRLVIVRVGPVGQARVAVLETGEPAGAGLRVCAAEPFTARAVRAAVQRARRVELQARSRAGAGAARSAGASLGHRRPAAR